MTFSNLILSISILTSIDRIRLQTAKNPRIAILGDSNFSNTFNETFTQQ